MSWRAAARALAFAAALAACGASAPSPITIELGPDAPLARHDAPIARPLIGANYRHIDETAPPLAGRAAGLDFVRTDLFWEDVERDGRMNFREYDDYLARLDGVGLRVLFILDYVHFQHVEGLLDTPAEIAAFARFAGAAAAHFRGRGVTWEVWNEPDVDESEHYLAPAVFARLVREAAHAIHAADPEAHVVSGGLSWIDLDYARGVFDEWDAHGRPEIVGFGAHPYRDAAPETALGDFAALGLQRDEHGAHWPFWSTEWGYSAQELSPRGNGHDREARARQAAHYARAMLTTWRAGVAASVWYELRDEGADPRDSSENFGLLDDRGAPKPISRALAAFAQQTAGLTLIGGLDHMPDGVEALKFAGGGRTMIVVWSTKPETRVAISADARGFIGAVNVEGARAQQLTLGESDGPVYLSWR